MIHFIYGESGFGKTHKVAELIKRDALKGIHTFLIVPEQQAVASERMMLRLLPPSAQLNLEILNFSRLYNRVCREYGGLEYNYITKPAKQLLMWRTISELRPMLEHYSKAYDKDSSLTDIMLGAVGEFKANGITPASLERAADKLPGDSYLGAKLRDIALIYSAYCAYVSESFSDSADDLSKLYAILKKHDFFKGCNVYIDSFTSFTAAEHSVIEEIFAHAANTTVTISLRSEAESDIYTGSISATERKLIEWAKRRGGYITEVLTENKRAKYPSLAFLARNVWNFKEQPCYTDDDANSAIYLERCATPYAEAEAAARWTLDLMRRGYRCRDIAVVSADANSYRGIIEPAFERNGIPFFFSEKSDLCSKSLLKFIISAFRIKKFGWRTTDVISHVKTGIYDILQSDCDMFESYVTTWNIRGEGFLSDDWTMNPDGYNRMISERGKRILAAANSVRRTLMSALVPFFTRLDAADSPREMCLALYDYLVSCKAEERLDEIGAKHQALGNIKEAEEYFSINGVTLNAIALAAELMPEEKLGSDEFASALKSVFDMTEIGTIPTSVDEVLIGSASMIRADNPRCVIVLGLCEGEFPRPVSESGVLNSSERSVLSELEIKFSSDSETRASDELMFVHKAFSLPSEMLILMTADSSADLSQKHPSLPYNRTKVLFPNVREHVFDPSDVTYLTGSAEDSSRYAYTQTSPAARASLTEALMAHSRNYSYLERQTPLSVSEPKATVSKETVSDIFPKELKLSQSRLEKYVKCHFSYYCSYILGLREEKKADFGVIDMGNFVHFLLENILKALLDENGQLTYPDDQTLDALAEKTVAEYLDVVLPQNQKNQGRLAHLCKRLKKLSILLTKNILEEFSHSQFTPAFFELKIGDGEDNVPPLEFVLNDGSRVSMRGVIDRVDIYRKDGTVYVRVVDYKTGSKNFSIDDLALGLNTQMLLYLFALCSQDRTARILRTDEPPVPSAMVYLSSNIPTLELESYSDTENTLKKAAKAFERSGLIISDEEILLAMNEDLSPDFLAGIKKNKKGEIVGSALTDLERFYQLRDEVEQTIAEIVTQMKSGSADAEPLCHKGESPCEYCEMKPVCRIIDTKKASPESDSTMEEKG